MLDVFNTSKGSHIWNVGGDAQNHDRSIESEFGFGNDLLYPIYHLGNFDTNYIISKNCFNLDLYFFN
jgi:hypothetical protein